VPENEQKKLARRANGKFLRAYANFGSQKKTRKVSFADHKKTRKFRDKKKARKIFHS
jgi:hypothetical protein